MEIKKIKKWSKKDIIKATHKIIKYHGSIKKSDLMHLHKKYNICCYQCIHDKFGSINQFGKEAEIKFKKQNRYRKWTKEKIIKKFKQIIKKHNNIKKNDLYEKYKEFNFCHPSTIKYNFGSLDNLAKQINYKFKKGEHGRRIWTHKKIINSMEKILQNNKSIKKIDIDIFQKKNQICGRDTIKTRFGSLDNFANYMGFNFISGKKSSIGKSEQQILDEIEKINNIKLKRQFLVLYNNKNYKIDGYDPINNIAYEVDEEYHQYQKIQDKIREQNIFNTLGCSFIRINEQLFLDRLTGQKNLEDF